MQDDSVFVSWNGATEVTQQRVIAGDDAASAESAQTVERDGFETEIPLDPGVAHVTLEALDDNSEVLATATPPGRRADGPPGSGPLSTTQPAACDRRRPSPRSVWGHT